MVEGVGHSLTQVCSSTQDPATAWTVAPVLQMEAAHVLLDIQETPARTVIGIPHVL